MNSIEELLVSEFNAEIFEDGYSVEVSIPVRDSVAAEWRIVPELIYVKVFGTDLVMDSLIQDDSGNIAHDFDYEGAAWFLEEDSSYLIGRSTLGGLYMECKKQLLKNANKVAVYGVLLGFAKSVERTRRSIERDLRISRETLQQFGEYFSQNPETLSELSRSQIRYFLDQISAHVEYYEGEIV